MKLLNDIKSTLIICKEQFIYLIFHMKWWHVICCLLLVGTTVLGISAANFAQEKYEKLETEVIEDEDIAINEHVEISLGTGYTNFVIFGSDSRKEDVEKNLNTDTIIIVSLNNETKEVKMVSVYRDTLLDVGNRNIQKCNSAYARGGAAQAISMLNSNFDLNIKKYVTVNFGAVADVVDMLGGIEVDITEAEMNAMNKYIKETAKIVDGIANLILEPGVQTIDGVQAVTYARIRKGVGDDFARTDRQREVIQQIYKKVLTSDFNTINGIVDAVLPQISTNFTMSEIVAYASNFLNYQFGDTCGFPIEKNTGTIGSRGSCVYATTLESNVIALHDMLFGELSYQPSDEVKKISIEIAYLVTASGKSPAASDEKEETKQENNKTKEESESSKEIEDEKESKVEDKQDSVKEKEKNNSDKDANIKEQEKDTSSSEKTEMDVEEEQTTKPTTESDSNKQESTNENENLSETDSNKKNNSENKQEESTEESVEKPEKEPTEELEEEAVEESVEEPVKESVEEPVEESVEEPAEEPVEESIEESAEEPAKEPVEEPVEEPAEEPAEEPVEEPAEEPAGELVEEPAEDPAEESEEESTKELDEKEESNDKSFEKENASEENGAE